MELVRWEPFEGLSKMQSRINDLFGESLGRSWTTPSVSTWHPPVDILESKDAYILRAELPGMKRGRFQLELKGWNAHSEHGRIPKTVDGVEYRSETGQRNSDRSRCGNCEA
jgi:HSP20 family molecular chaperone IbpA